MLPHLFRMHSNKTLCGGREWLCVCVIFSEVPVILSLLRYGQESTHHWDGVRSRRMWDSVSRRQTDGDRCACKLWLWTVVCGLVFSCSSKL